MLISYNWLKKYFEKLPTPEEISDAFSKHLTEIEKVEEVNDDMVFDIKVLSDRACYAQSHLGIAYELSAIKNIPLKENEINSFSISKTPTLEIKVEEKELCSRYIGRRIDNIEVRESVTWLKEKLENIGQRSINNIIDTLNYVMFDMGQPLHAFDADKVEGKIIVRFAKVGETITTLDNKEVKLDPTILVIADEKDCLAIAGIKGGKKAEVNSKTKNIIIESANFNKSLIRNTSLRINIKTDASKRYENGLTTDFTKIGIEQATTYIAKFNSEVKIGPLVDIKNFEPKPKQIKTTFEFISNLIGIDVSEEEISEIFRRLNINFEEKSGEITLTPPPYRLDLNIPEDFAEEVARIYGYEKIPSTILGKVKLPHIENRFFVWREKIKDILKEIGFSEILTHTLSSKGELEIEKSADDKKFLRTNLSENMEKALTLNLYNAPLLGLEQIRIFEIGKVFQKGEEFTSLCIGISNTKLYKGESINEEIRKTREHVIEKINSNITTLCTIDDNGGILVLKGKAIGKINEIDGVMEFNLDVLEADLPAQAGLPEIALGVGFGTSVLKYKTISPYPFVLRDIAVFVPSEEGKEGDVLEIIKKHATGLLIRADLFDTFTKREKEKNIAKTSFAFRLVFQSHDKTLTDEEINKIMDQIASQMKEKGYEVR